MARIDLYAHGIEVTFILEGGQSGHAILRSGWAAQKSPSQTKLLFCCRTAKEDGFPWPEKQVPLRGAATEPPWPALEAGRTTSTPARPQADPAGSESPKSSWTLPVVAQPQVWFFTVQRSRACAAAATRRTRPPSLPGACKRPAAVLKKPAWRAWHPERMRRTTGHFGFAISSAWPVAGYRSRFGGRSIPVEQCRVLLPQYKAASVCGRLEIAPSEVPALLGGRSIRCSSRV